MSVAVSIHGVKIAANMSPGHSQAVISAVPQARFMAPEGEMTVHIHIDRLPRSGAYIWMVGEWSGIEFVI